MAKTNGNNRAEFLRSDAAVVLRENLTDMTESPLYNTRVVSILESDPLRFVEKHMTYMSNHLEMDHSQYVNNLKLMTKVTQFGARRLASRQSNA